MLSKMKLLGACGGVVLAGVMASTANAALQISSRIASIDGLTDPNAAALHGAWNPVLNQVDLTKLGGTNHTFKVIIHADITTGVADPDTGFDGIDGLQSVQGAVRSDLLPVASGGHNRRAATGTIVPAGKIYKFGSPAVAGPNFFGVATPISFADSGAQNGASVPSGHNELVTPADLAAVDGNADYGSIPGGASWVALRNAGGIIPGNSFDVGAYNFVMTDVYSGVDAGSETVLSWDPRRNANGTPHSNLGLWTENGVANLNGASKDANGNFNSFISVNQPGQNALLFTAVPEPGTLGAVAFGAVGLLARIRRRKTK